jgi:lipopolysaccharide export LptBFGC system permease protein LptF
MIIKIIYFVVFILSIVLTLSFMGLSFDHWLHPFKKNSEAALLFLSGIITIIGMYYSIKFGYKPNQATYGIFQLLGTWVVAAIFLTIGLVFFNGTSK